MRKLIIALCLFASNAFASQQPFVGTWFSCDINSGEYQALKVEKTNNQYTGLLESSRGGGVYSSLLSGAPHNSGLTLQGCQSYRGESCSAAKTPVTVTLKNGSKSSGFIRISEQSLNQNIKKCSANSRQGVH